MVAPARERGLKYMLDRRQVWSDKVAPARERGLKLMAWGKYHNRKVGRSREGAWIEIVAVESNKVGFCGSLPRGSVD